MRALLSKTRNVPGITLTLIAMVVFVYAIIASQDFREISQWFPIGVSFVGLVLSLIVMLWELGIVTAGGSDSLEGDATEGDVESTMSARRGFLTYMTWLVVLAASMIVFGGLLTILVWLILFFRFRSRESWIRSILYSLAAVVVIVILAAVLHVFLPTGELLPSGSWIPRINIRF